MSEVQDAAGTPSPRFRRVGKLTLVMTVWPSWRATNSFTFEPGASSSLLPPMKWEAKLCFSAYVAWPLRRGTVTPFLWPLATPWPFCSPIVLLLGDEVVGVENDATVLPGLYHFMQTTRVGGRDSRRSCRTVVGDFPESDSEKVGGAPNAMLTGRTSRRRVSMYSCTVLSTWQQGQRRGVGSKSNLNARREVDEKRMLSSRVEI